MRYRLRFLLQEFDLPNGVTVIGRSLDCNLTIEDPLVSREHARITLDGETAILEDTRSRNGVRVNGFVIHEPTVLRDGDRVRIGTQEMVFCAVEPDERVRSRTTGVLRLCANCRLPYPREASACPHCEATEQTDEETLTDDSNQHRDAWNLQLLLETLDRARALGRVDVERLVHRATAQLDEMMTLGRAIDVRVLGTIAAKVVGIAILINEPKWTVWALETYRRNASVPPLALVDLITEAGSDHLAPLRKHLEALVEELELLHANSGEELEALARLRQIQSRIAQEVGEPEGEVEDSGEPVRQAPSLP